MILEMDMLRYLENSRIVKYFNIIDFRRWDKGQYLNIKIEFIDKSVLFVKEYQDEMERNYSFHWQDENNKLKIRWDNSPHYPEQISFPHHKHLPDRLAESREITLKEVLGVIEKEIDSHI